jgi:GDP-L-fucose synthase
MQTDARIYVAGGDTLIGSAILRRLRAEGCRNLIGGADGGSADPDFADPAAVRGFLARHRPEYVFIAAGRSGGIEANRRYPASLMLDNLNVAAHLIPAAYEAGVRRLLYLASSCSYPRLCPQPMRPEHLLTGPLEPTNEAYAVAKIAGMALCRAYRAEHGADFVVALPANSFGPGDDFDHHNAHVVSALIRRMHEAAAEGRPSVDIWGTGSPRREFLYVDDLADAAVFAMRRYRGDDPVNLSGGTDVSIRELAGLIREVVGYAGELRFDPARPDGMPLKSLDGRVLAELGWRAATGFRDALAATYRWYLENLRNAEPVPA